MAKKNDVLDGLTPEQQQAEIDLARKVLASSSNYVIEAFEEFQDQAHALATALVQQFTPNDEKSLPDGYPMTAWRLAQVLEEHLSRAHCAWMARSVLLGED